MSVAGPAFAATSASGSENLTLTAGTLSVSNVQPGTLTGTVAGTATGTLPSADFADNTGTGAGWNGTIALSTFSYTGAWSGSAAATDLANTTAGSYTGTNDGDTYTVTVGSGATSSSVPFTWTSTYNTTGGSGTATPGTPAAVGSNGVTIDFSTSTVPASGDAFQVQVGAQPNSAVSLTTADGTVTANTGTTSTDPTLVNNATTVAGGGVGTLGTAVKAVSAALGTGMGSYNVAPGASAVTDAASWAQTYTANAQYTIVSGP
jgi:hypothetical protein